MFSFSRAPHVLAMAAIIGSFMAIPVAEAKPRGSYRPSVSRPAPPKPAPQVVNRTTNNTTVIRQTRIVQPAAPSGPGIGSTILGTAAGSAIGTTAGVMLGNALSKPEEPQQPQQVIQPQQITACDSRFYNCEPKVK